MTDTQAVPRGRVAASSALSSALSFPRTASRRWHSALTVEVNARSG